MERMASSLVWRARGKKDMAKCIRCHKEVRLKDGKKFDPKTDKPHQCREDAYDLPEHKSRKSISAKLSQNILERRASDHPDLLQAVCLPPPELRLCVFATLR